VIQLTEDTLAQMVAHLDEYGDCPDEWFDALVAEVRRLQPIEALAGDLASQIKVCRSGSTVVKDATAYNGPDPALDRFWGTIRAIAIAYQGEPSG
jgi:hypothetical protein